MSGYVYVLASPHGQRKVGYASKLDRRVSEITPKMPWAVNLEMTYSHPQARKIESKLHKILADAHDHGEWFSCSLDRIKAALRTPRSHGRFGAFASPYLNSRTASAVRESF